MVVLLQVSPIFRQPEAQPGWPLGSWSSLFFPDFSVWSGASTRNTTGCSKLLTFKNLWSCCALGNLHCSNKFCSLTMPWFMQLKHRLVFSQQGGIGRFSNPEPEHIDTYSSLYIFDCQRWFTKIGHIPGDKWGVSSLDSTITFSRQPVWSGG